MKHDACWVTTQNGDIVMAIGAAKINHMTPSEGKHNNIMLLSVGGHEVLGISARPEAEVDQIMEALRSALLEDRDVDIREIIKDLASDETKNLR